MDPGVPNMLRAHLKDAVAVRDRLLTIVEKS
jgi:hypothetical protein